MRRNAGGTCMAEDVIDGLPNHPLALPWAITQKLFDRWKLPVETRIALLQVFDETYQSWVESGIMSEEGRALGNARELLRIYIGLSTMFGDKHAELSRAWMHGKNSASLFKDKSPLDTILTELPTDPKIIKKIADHIEHHVAH